MIELYREEISSEADWIEADLKGMAAGYERHIVTPLEVTERFGLQVQLPVLRDGDRFASGREEIRIFLEEFSRLVENWRKFQSDSCYLDDEGDVC